MKWTSVISLSAPSQLRTSGCGMFLIFTGHLCIARCSDSPCVANSIYFHAQVGRLCPHPGFQVPDPPSRDSTADSKPSYAKNIRFTEVWAKVVTTGMPTRTQSNRWNLETDPEKQLAADMTEWISFTNPRVSVSFSCWLSQWLADWNLEDEHDLVKTHLNGRSRK